MIESDKDKKSFPEYVQWIVFFAILFVVGLILGILANKLGDSFLR